MMHPLDWCNGSGDNCDGCPACRPIEEKKKMAYDIHDIKRNFMYHAPTSEQTRKYVDIRDKAKEFAMMIHDYCPDSREKSLAFTKLEEAVFWANASIARNE